MKKIIITEAYEYYWKFATERQSIFYNRYENKAKITNNPILKKYKFTNAYRASDRVSQYLIKEVIYKNNNYSLDDILFSKSDLSISEIYIEHNSLLKGMFLKVHAIY